MNRLWPLFKLGEVLTTVSRPESVDPEKTYKILGAHWYAKGLYIKETLVGSEIRADKVYKVQAGDFVYNRLFAWKGSFAVATKEDDHCYVSNEFPCFAVNEDKADAIYLWKYFSRSAAWDEALGLSSGGTPTSRNRLKEENFLALKVPLPPFPEQRRIVARIETLAGKINEARALRQQAVKEAEMVLNAAMKTRFDFLGAPTTVADYAEVQGGYAFPSSEYDEFGTHQVVRIGNVRDGFLDLSRAPVRWTAGKDSRVLKYELNTGDLIISMTGTRNKRDYGFIAKVPPGEKLLLNQRVGRFVIHRELDRDYLFYFLRSPFFRDNLFPSATGTANQANVGNADIESVPFAAPQDVSEQRRIVAELDGLQAQMDTLKKLQDETAAELDALLPSILDRAFNGEL